jgi:hypothetical protein
MGELRGLGLILNRPVVVMKIEGQCKGEIPRDQKQRDNSSYVESGTGHSTISSSALWAIQVLNETHPRKAVPKKLNREERCRVIFTALYI